MLGWEIFITLDNREKSGNKLEKSFASWKTGLFSFDWMNDLVANGTATVISNSGYPASYSLKLKDLLPHIENELPSYKSPTVIGDNYLYDGNSNYWNIKIDKDFIKSLDPETQVIFEAWDQS